MFKKDFIVFAFIAFLMADITYGNVKESCSDASCRPIKIVREVR